jgi:glycosyltransferase involved in cell wall biosynthesis
MSLDLPVGRGGAPAEAGTGAWPLVTINIPTYNQQRHVARAIQSALGQDYPNLEVVVVDDCSDDDSFAVAKSIADPRLRLCRNEQNLGRVRNYRKALYELARGDWVVNLDGDDYYDDPTFISDAMARVRTDPEIVMYAAGSKTLHEESGEIECAPLAVPAEGQVISGVDYVLSYPRLGVTQHFAVLYDRARALETGFYVLDSLGTDTDSLCRLALQGKVYVHGKHVGVWTHHEANASYSLTEATVDKEMKMLAHIADALADHVPKEVAAGWLHRREREKRRVVENLTLTRLPLREACRYWYRHKRAEIFYLKEGVKLALRGLGLRRAG